MGASLALGRVNDCWACAACGCGDPTLTVFGLEKPLMNRVRFALEARYRSDDLGRSQVDRIQIRESRIEGQFAWSAYERLSLMLQVPLLLRSVRYVNGAERNTRALGDL